MVRVLSYLSIQEQYVVDRKSGVKEAHQADEQGAPDSKYEKGSSPRGRMPTSF